MAATLPVRGPATERQNHPKIAKPSAAAIAHAVRLIHAVCGLAGSATWIDDIRADLRADKVQAAIRHRETAVVFDWLMAALSYQGIADAVAYDYMERHGRAAWRDIDQKLGRGVQSPQAQATGISMAAATKRAAGPVPSPSTSARCPLPSHDLRNGHLNQTAYSLFLFIRDIADGDLDRLDRRPTGGRQQSAGPDRLPAWAAALIEPMREIYGVSDKVLAMALSALLLGAPKKLVLWAEVGAA